MPTYVNSQLHFDVQMSGIIAITPSISGALIGFISGRVCDVLLVCLLFSSSSLMFSSFSFPYFLLYFLLYFHFIFALFSPYLLYFRLFSLYFIFIFSFSLFRLMCIFLQEKWIPLVDCKKSVFLFRMRLLYCNIGRLGLQGPHRTF